MVTKNSIEMIIRDAIYSVTQMSNLDGEENLMSRKLGVFPADYIYIFDIIERKTQLPVHSVLENNTFEVMTINGLTDKIYELYHTYVKNNECDY